MKLNVNIDSVVSYTNCLEKMHKSAFPNAVRGALNKAAFDVKQSTLQKSADRSFVKRSPNFFKAFSRVDMAEGFNLKTMQAQVGMTSKGLNGGNNFAVEDLEQQEDGGSISGRSFIPLKPARGGNSARVVKQGNRISKIKKIIKAADVRSVNGRQRFIRAAIKAKEVFGTEAYVLGNVRNGRQTLSRINRVDINSKKRTVKIKRTPLYTFKKGFKARVTGTDFSKRAGLESGLKIRQFYIDEANRQFEKLKIKI